MKRPHLIIKPDAVRADLNRSQDSLVLSAAPSSTVHDSDEAPLARVRSRKGVVVFLVSHSAGGGAQEIWANLAEGFAARGYEVLLAALYPSETSLRESSPEIPWHHIVAERPTTPFAQFSMLKGLVDFIKRYKPSVIFTALPAANVLAPIATKLANCGSKVVISHHSPAQTYHPALNWVDGLAGALGEVAAIVSVSATVQKSLDDKPRLYRAKRRMIMNALPPRIERIVADLAANRPQGKATTRRVVATGRLAPQKNYPALIRAAARMPNVEIQIIGAGPDEEQLKQQAADLGVADRVKFLGFVPRETVLAHVAAADIFTQPSLFEGHSLALIEAAKIGLPLVVSDAPVQIEGITAQGGMLCGIAVGVQDDEGLANAVVGLLDDPERYEDYSARARHLADGVTYEGMMDAYEALVPSR